MIIIAYIVIAIAALVMVYFGHLQGGNQFYTSILGATFVIYCIYLDFRKRFSKKDGNDKNGKSVKKTQHSGKKSNTNISQNARRSTKNIK